MRWTRARVEAALEEIARTEAPAPRPDFVAGLERRLSGRATMPSTSPARSPVRVPLALRLAAAAAVVAGVVIVLDQRPGSEVRLVTPAASTSSTASSESAPVTTSTTLVPDPPFIAMAPTTTTTANRQAPAPSTTSTTGAKPVADTRPKPPPDGEPRQTTTTTRAGERTTTTTTSEAGAASPSSSLRLACGPVQDRDAIACSWSEGPAGTAGFKLWREVPGEARRAVYAVRDPSARRYLDTAVSAGVTYTYLIEALDESGRVIARGGPVEVTCC